MAGLGDVSFDDPEAMPGFALDLETGAFEATATLRPFLALPDSVPLDSEDDFVELVHPEDRTLLAASIAAHRLSVSGHLDTELRLSVDEGDDDDATDSLRWLIMSTTVDAEQSRLVATFGTTQRSRSQGLLRRSVHDPLTGLATRSLLVEELNRARRRSSRADNSQVAVLYLDLAGFKEVNDRWGHDVGDQVLRAVGRRLQVATRPDDLGARIGGDEFAVVFTRLQRLDEARAIAERIVDLLSRPVTIDDVGEVTVRPSAGLVLTDAIGWTPSQLLQQADAAMYRAKRRGSVDVDCTVLADSTRVTIDGRARLEAEVSEGRVLLHYQPVVNLADSTLQGIESMLRWRVAGRGLVPAPAILAVADDIGAGRWLSRWCLSRSLEQASVWHGRHGDDVPPITVNLNRDHILDPHLVDDVAALLDTHQLPGTALRVDVAEASLTGSFDLSTLRALRDLGVGIQIERFGDVDGSLVRLEKLEPAAVKLSRTLVGAVVDEPRIARRVGALCAGARAFGIEIVAVGVELPAARQMLLDLGCDAAQGSLFDNPLDSAALSRRLAGSWSASSATSAALGAP